MEFSWQIWKISKSGMILLWWLDRERHLRKSLLCCFPGWHIWYCVKWTSCSVDFAKDSFNQLFFRPNPMTADDIHMIYPHIKGTCPLWHFGEEMNTWLLDQPKSWHGSGFPTLKGLDVFNLSQAIFSWSQILLFLLILSRLQDHLSWESVFNQYS